MSTTVAQHSGQLNDAITQLSGASSGLVTLLVPNIAPLEADVGTVTTVGRTLDRNLANVDEILQNGNNLFQGAQRAYDPNYNWLDLNLQLAPGVTGAYLAGLLRDRLAGICRRLAANHSSGPLRVACSPRSPSAATRRRASSTPLVNDIPAHHQHADGGERLTTAQALLQQGLQQIENATQGAGAGTSTTRAAGRRPTRRRARAPRPPPRPRRRRPPRPRPSRATCSPSLLGCKPASGSCSSGSSSSSSTRGRARARVAASAACSPRTPAAATQKASIARRDAVRRPPPPRTPTPSLTAPAAACCRRCPRTRPMAMPGRHHHAQRGLLSQWAHDVASWF